jgi:transposase InsO family protein
LLRDGSVPAFAARPRGWVAENAARHSPIALLRASHGQTLVHSDQGCQHTGHDWQGFLRDYNLVSSMSYRVNCHVNAVDERFFQLLKRCRIRRQIYPTRQDA